MYTVVNVCLFGRVGYCVAQDIFPFSGGCQNSHELQCIMALVYTIKHTMLLRNQSHDTSYIIMYHDYIYIHEIFLKKSLSLYIHDTLNLINSQLENSPLFDGEHFGVLVS